jgi:hypothetical protein
MNNVAELLNAIEQGKWAYARAWLHQEINGAEDSPATKRRKKNDE